MKGKISEVFDSVQGEGLYLGEQQLFVRFFGCNLNCGFCDTKPQSFTEYEPQELLVELNLYQGTFDSISFTGGEPLLQAEFLKELLELMGKSQYRHYLETNGTLPDELRGLINYIDIVAMDIKLPSSTGQGPFWDKHRRFLEIASLKEVFLKTVICKSTKEEDLKETLKLIKEVKGNAVLVLQPNSFEKYSSLKKKLKNFKAISIKEGVTTCVIPQVHKEIGIK